MRTDRTCRTGVCARPPSSEHGDTPARPVEPRKRKRLEELIRSRDEFVAAVSHELRTPLTSVVGLSHELRDRHREFAEEEAGDLVAVIADQSLEVADIIDDLLVSGRADIGTLIIDPVPIDVADMLDGIMRTDLTAGFERVDIEGIQVTPFADPMRLRQILPNLIGNAACYGGSGFAS